MPGSTLTWAWIACAVTIFALLALDLYVHRRGRADSHKGAIGWSIVWVAAGLAFNLGVWVLLGSNAAQEYLAAYLIEKSLSIDNLFVFLVIFRTLKIPEQRQRTVLSWGIFGALLFRALFIFVGLAAIERWAWISYLFGAVLIWAAWRAFRQDPCEQQENRVVEWLAARLPLTASLHGSQFLAKANGKRVATPLLLAIVAVEFSDIMFAVDSVPAAFSVSHNRFVVLSSNAFAILGLRALYIVLAKTLAELHYLHYGLAAVLGFAGMKIVTQDLLEIPPYVSIAVIALIIGVSVWFSVRRDKREARRGGRAARAAQYG
jgi:tellurite resistance protein TerC